MSLFVAINEIAQDRRSLSFSSIYLTIYVHLSLQNAVGKMCPLALVLASCFCLLQVVVRCQELSVIRHSDGDIFTIEGKYSLIAIIINS